MTIPTTGVLFIDILIGLIVFVLTGGLSVELWKSISTSLSKRSEQKTADKKRIRVESEVNRKLALHWERKAHEAWVAGIQHGIPREELPDMSPPTIDTPISGK